MEKWSTPTIATLSLKMTAGNPNSTGNDGQLCDLAELAEDILAGFTDASGPYPPSPEPSQSPIVPESN